MSQETLHLIVLLVWVGIWFGVGYYAHTLGRRWYVWMLVAVMIVPNFIVLIILAYIGRAKVKPIVRHEPTQVEKDLREVARILNDRPLPAKTQWKIVTGMIALIMLGIGATVLYAQTIQPQHHVVTYQAKPNPQLHLPPPRFHNLWTQPEADF
jgi:hypothetical protein